MSSSSFRGVGTALITPFAGDGSLDEAALEKFVDWQITEGVNFLVPCGTTGENPTLSADEHRRVVELTVKTANGRVPVLAGAGSNATPRAVELALQAVDLGADGILTITPYYNKPTPDGLRRHFGAQAEAVEKKKSGFPMIMYNVPGRTGLNMTAETTLRMAREIPNVIGVKEASGNLEQILTILRERPKDFLVLSGDDAWTLPLMAVGAEGVISVASNEVPRLMRAMVDTRDAAIHTRLLPLLLGNFIEANPGPAKAALVMMGVLASDVVRPPLAPMTEGNRAKLRAILEECGLL
ncbi:MAG TPA: 4-hydroxy-tetrahydrodipicolinate synthase [Thermoanaerobaculia bacterium]|jgi:4-hydroxy-tetrahydrodipicolinate synthase|nr:4-hydroxy-tetrahydrodipicolinate synthase [Thermoanaerobaculia bacterium]